MTKKIAVSLPDSLVEDAHAAVAAGRADSVSGYVAEAMAGRPQDTDLESVVQDLIAEFGEPSEEDYAWARDALGLE